MIKIGTGVAVTNGPVVAGSGGSTDVYRQPNGTDVYKRPGGNDVYRRP